MSASPVARQATQSQAIPSRRMIINSASQMPNDYSTTPGGTIFSTTPGGTRIVYERAFLLQLRNSPMSATPPKNIQYIPGVSPNKQSGLCDNNNVHKAPAQRQASPPSIQSNKSAQRGVDEQFEMDL